MEWFQYLIAPAVVGIVTLLGQRFIQPRIALASNRALQRQEMKKAVFVQALAVLDQYLNAQLNLKDFGGDFEGHVPLPGVPTPTMNAVLSSTYLLADDQRIPKLLLKLLGPELDGTLLVTRGELINAMRRELHSHMEAAPAEKVPFYVNKAPAQQQE